ncbi:MAG: hypothetical protein DWI21_07395 [Planctomycetota bacterium]|nr:MAG: hypothetical protein DWI21_07395 [Planctomycetota bacterium]
MRPIVWPDDPKNQHNRYHPHDRYDWTSIATSSDHTRLGCDDFFGYGAGRLTGMSRRGKPFERFALALFRNVSSLMRSSCFQHDAPASG